MADEYVDVHICIQRDRTELTVRADVTGPFDSLIYLSISRFIL